LETRKRGVPHEELPRDSVALVAQVVALDKSLLTERCGKVPPEPLELILAGLDIALGR